MRKDKNKDKNDEPKVFQSLLDAHESIMRRDKGMADVLYNEISFARQLYAFVFNLPIGWIGLTEDIRDGWRGIQPHPNAWGSCWHWLMKWGLLRHLDDEVHMRAKRSHARRTHLCMRVQPPETALGL
jgi:hypothetical protein